MRNTEIHTLLYKSFTTFENWPVNYFSFFDWRREQEQASEKHYRGLRKDFNEYKHALYRQLDSPHLNFMREGFEEYLSTRWHGGYISGIKRMSDTTRQNKKYVSFNEAVKLLNVGRDGLKRLIDEGRLDALVRPAGKTSMTLLELCHVNQLKAELDQLLSRTQAKDLLGISFERTPELVDCNLLRLRHHPTDLSNPLRYCRQEIEELLAHTKSKVLNKASLKQHKMMALTTVLRLLPDCEAGLGQFIKAICEGKMNPCRMNIKRGLGGLYFHDIDVMNYVRELIRKRIGNVVRVDEAAKSLGVQKQFVYLLIKSGLLITRKLLVNGRMNQFITTRSINIFSSTYVLPCMLAQGVHINANKIAKMLAGQGIYPIAAPLGGDHRYTIFRKSDLDGVDIKSLIKNKKPQQYYRMGDRLVDLDQASILLGISKEAIQEYVRNGVLSPCNQLSHSHFMKGSLCFSKYTIDAFKTQAPNYVGLVSANVAAAMLGKHIRNFNIKYVRTCRLSPVYIDGKPGKRFFRIKDIEAMIELEKATIGSGSVAGILKVSMSSIYRMVLSGELKPISGPHVDGYPVNLYLRVDVEKLKTARDAFRSECVRVGKMTRYSKPSDNRSCPVQEKIIPRVKQWLKDQFSRNGMTQRICGLELQRLLLSEGYKIATTTIYKVLRKQLEQHSMAQGGV
jgi:hypothetical protein